jgi:hypothetical protein
MWRTTVIAGVLVGAVLAGCGGQGAEQRHTALPRVEVRGGHGTDISALPTVAPPPPLKAAPKSGKTVEQPVRTPTPSSTPDTTSVDPNVTRGPVLTAPTPTRSTPTETLGPEQGGG